MMANIEMVQKLVDEIYLIFIIRCKLLKLKILGWNALVVVDYMMKVIMGLISGDGKNLFIYKNLLVKVITKMVQK
ncbi:unnamed protein product [Paramecium pentaurelia]|uniref:Uncharacterized protein n=1 Tax=Paramecium pentaurelia TaxID=43138 RepID=A0A8S1THM2_9CILI|nr:unnamed protein product [Paramecium pentaurelia]